MAVEAVVFDWGGTLTPWHTVELDDVWLVASGDPELAARLVEAELAVWARSRDEHRSATLAEVIEAAGGSEALLANYHSWWEPHTFIDPDVPSLFAELRARDIKVGVLSNTLWPRTEHERIFARDGVLELIDAAVYTSEIPWTKPHAEAFRAALVAVGVTDPANAVFVGDRVFDDIHGAKSIGMRAVLLPHSDIPDVQRGPVSGEPDAVVQRLSELLPLVDAWR